MEEMYFDHEKLKVYQKALEFVKWGHAVLKSIGKKNSTTDQFDRAADSIVLNIAEGNGKFSKKDKCRYFDISKGSTLESAGCLDLMYVKEMINSETKSEGKLQLKEIVSMLMGLIKANSDRVYEDEFEYGTQKEDQEQDHE